MSNKDAFAGMALSQQVTPLKLDQRLFAEPPAPTPATTARSSPQLAKTKPKLVEPTPDPASAPAQAVVTVSPVREFDLAEEALYKATFTFSQLELEALEDLKLEFRRDHDTKVTKNDLVRAAVHMLVEDHCAQRHQSYISRKLRQR